MEILFIDFCQHFLSKITNKGVHQFPGGVYSRKLYTNSAFLWRFQKIKRKKFRQIFGFKFSIFGIQLSNHSRLQRQFEGFENIRVKYKIHFEKIWKFVHPCYLIWRFQKSGKKYFAIFSIYRFWNLLIDYEIYK